MAIDSHVHISPVHFLAVLLFVFAMLATLHLLALTAADSRLARAYIATGF